MQYHVTGAQLLGMVHGSSRRREGGAVDTRQLKTRKQYIAAWPHRHLLRRCCLAETQRPETQSAQICVEPLDDVRRTPAPARRDDRSQGTGPAREKVQTMRPPENRRSRTLETDIASRDKHDRDGWAPGQSACQVTNSLCFWKLPVGSKQHWGFPYHGITEVASWYNLCLIGGRAHQTSYSRRPCYECGSDPCCDG